MSGEGETFKCEHCHGRFRKAFSDEEAEAEARSVFTPAELADTGIVCDDCWRDLMGALPRIRAEIDQEAAAAGLSVDAFVRREAQQ